jgi:hypothetical protein
VTPNLLTSSFSLPTYFSGREVETFSGGYTPGLYCWERRPSPEPFHVAQSATLGVLGRSLFRLPKSPLPALNLGYAFDISRFSSGGICKLLCKRSHSTFIRAIACIYEMLDFKAAAAAILCNSSKFAHPASPSCCIVYFYGLPQIISERQQAARWAYNFLPVNVVRFTLDSRDNVISEFRGSVTSICRCFIDG